MKRALRSDARGSVMLELVIALLPVLALAGWAWHELELRAGQLVVQRAASAAARAAAVILPDDPADYAGEAVGHVEGERRAQIELAAALVLASAAQFRELPRLELTRNDGAVSARLSARFDSWLGWPRAGRVLVASASAPYQGARYLYRSQEARR